MTDYEHIVISAETRKQQLKEYQHEYYLEVTKPKRKIKESDSMWKIKR